MDFPEPLFESGLHQPKICLVCARSHATRALRTIGREIVPICAGCSSDWNLYGYEILKRIKPRRLIQRLLLFKLLHPFRPPSWRTIFRDLGTLKEWARRMKKWMR